MQAYLVKAIGCLLLSFGVFWFARWLRCRGQHTLDTGKTPAHSFLNLPPKDTPTPKIYGQLDKLAGLMGYFFAAGVLYFAIEFLFRAIAELVGDDFFKRLSSSNGDLVAAIILFCQALGFFWIARRLRLMGDELPYKPTVRQVFSLFGSSSYFLAGSVLVFAILVPVYGRILLHVSSSP